MWNFLRETSKHARLFIFSFMLLIPISGFIIGLSFCGEGGESEKKNGFQVIDAIYWDWCDETNAYLTYDGSEPRNVTIYKKEWWFHEWLYSWENIGMMYKGDTILIGFHGHATWIEVLYDEERFRLSFFPERIGETGEADLITTVSSIIDGDTFDTASGDRIRLADIDAPESGESGYHEAKNFLTSLVQDKTVYLDIDDVYRTDKYGRLVCVAYICVTIADETFSKNINKALVEEGVAVVSDYDNEFNPWDWNLICGPIPEFPSFLILPLFMIATLLTVIYFKKRKSSCASK